MDRAQIKAKMLQAIDSSQLGVAGTYAEVLQALALSDLADLIALAKKESDEADK